MNVFTDPRHIAAGRRIPTESYADQPYVVRTDDGAWLCVLTTGGGREGEPGQHVVALRSKDRGRTWSPPVNVEPPGGPEASYAVLLKTPRGRIYAFYNHNTDRVRRVRADDPPFKGGWCRRVDSLGHFVFKFSDDHGRTWSSRRYDVPVREMAIDRENADRGKLRYFWNVGRPFVHAGAAYVSLHKVGGFGEGFFTRSEGVLLRSDNILTENDPRKLRWETLPEGDAGLRTPPGGGPVAEEHSYAVLSDGSFYCVYRTVDGHPACARSRDSGRTWTTPEYQRYADGRLMKHPRAANFVWKCANGKFLYWFHNHGGRFVREAARAGKGWSPYEDRNPVWLCGGVEADTPDGKTIRWSQPEILLYDDDPHIRMSYPDLIEDAGRHFVTETQKTVARVHELDPKLLEGLWSQIGPARVASHGLILTLPPARGRMPKRAAMPLLPHFSERDHAASDGRSRDTRQGFALDLWVRFNSLRRGQTVLDTRAEDAAGQAGLSLGTAAGGALELTLCDGRTENRWASDAGRLKAGWLHHVAVMVDGGPRVITFVIDGVLCDGGGKRQFGWGRFSPHLRHANGAKWLRIAPRMQGAVKALRIYSRHLRTSEAVGNYRAGPAPRSRAGRSKARREP